MTSLYGRAGTNDWAVAASWSLTDGGGATGSVPTAADDVFLTSNSGTMNLSAASVCRSINCTGFTGSFGPNNVSGASLTIGDGTAGAGNVALKFVSGMTYSGVNSFTQTITFVSTSATVQTIDFANKSTPPVTFNATSGGSWQYTGGHTIGATWTLTLTKGTLDINGQTCSWGSFNASNSNVRSLTLGSAAITITGSSATTWDVGTQTNLTLSAASSTITLNGASAIWTANGTWGTVNFTGSGAASMNNSSASTFGTLTRTGTAVKTDTFRIQGNHTVTGVLTFTGNSSINRLLIFTNTVGTTNTFTTTGATVTATNTDFQDITLSVAKDFSAQTDIGDCGGNSGITFPASVAQTWNSTLSGNWSGNNWSVNTPTFTALQTASQNTGTGSTVVVTIGATTQYSLVVVHIKVSNGENCTSVTDDKGNTYTLSSGLIQSSGSAFVMYQAYARQVVGGVTSITANFSGSSVAKRVGADEYAGGSATDIIVADGSSTGTGTSTSATVSTLTPTNTNRLIVSTLVNDATVTWTAGSGHTLYNGTGSVTVRSQYKLSGSATETAPATLGSSGSWAEIATAFKLFTRVPLPQDDVVISSAFSASQTVTADMPRLGRSISWTGATGTPAWALGSTTVAIYGSLTMISGMTTTGTGGIVVFAGRGSYSITSSGVQIGSTCDVNITAPGGTYILNDAITLSSTKAVTVNNGTFNTNGFSYTAGGLLSNVSTTRSIILGSSILTINGNSTFTYWNFSNASGLTFSGASSTIVWGTSTFTRTFAGGGQTYGTLTYTVAGSIGGLNITGSNSFAQINFSDTTNARSLLFTAGTTTTIRNGNGFNVQGTSGKLMTVSSITGATHTLASTSRQVCSYLNVSYSIASAGLFYAQTTSTDGLNNTNWIFTDAPVLSVGGGSNGIQNRMNLQNLRSLV